MSFHRLGLVSCLVEWVGRKGGSARRIFVLSVVIFKITWTYRLKRVSISSMLNANESMARMFWAAGRVPLLPLNRTDELTVYGDSWEVWGDCDSWGTNWERLDAFPDPTTSVLRFATMTWGCWLCTASLNVTSCFSSSSILLWEVRIAQNRWRNFKSYLLLLTLLYWESSLQGTFSLAHLEHGCFGESHRNCSTSIFKAQDEQGPI